MNIEEIKLDKYYWEKLKPFLQEQHDELGMNGGPKELDIAYDSYEYMQSHHVYVGFVVEDDDGEIVGYAGFTIYQHPHYAMKRFAISDVLYIVPKYRESNPFAIFKLIRFAEKRLRFKYRVNYLQLVENSSKDLSIMMRRLNMTLSDKVYVKEL
jgi:hypothetical protein